MVSVEWEKSAPPACEQQDDFQDNSSPVEWSDWLDKRVRSARRLKTRIAGHGALETTVDQTLMRGPRVFDYVTWTG